MNQKTRNKNHNFQHSDDVSDDVSDEGFSEHNDNMTYDDNNSYDRFEENSGPRIILQVVTPSSEATLNELPGEELLKWKNVLLKKLDTRLILRSNGELSESEESEESQEREESQEEEEESQEEEEERNCSLNISIWQLTDVHPGNTKGRKLDGSVFCPQLDAFLIFYDVKEPGTLREWLAVGTHDTRLQGLSPIIIGTHKKGESTQHFQKIFGNKKGVFLWEVGDQEALKRIYSEIFELLF